MTLHQRGKNAGGFTMIEMAMVLIIAGFIMSSIYVTFNVHTRQLKMDVTERSIDLAVNMLTEFNGLAGRWPCPADPTLGPDDAGYGVEMRDAGTGNCIAWRSASTPNRDLDGDGVADLVDFNQDGAADRILFGALPFRTMLDPNGDGNPNDGIMWTDKISNDLDFSMDDMIESTQGWGIDGYGTKLMYVVTENITRPTAFSGFMGVIDIVDENGRTVITPEQSALFLILSMGPNGRGGYSWDGALIENCINGIREDAEAAGDPPPPGATQNEETENCDLFDTRFVAGLRNESDYSHFDDTLRFRTTSAMGIWETAGALIDDNGTPGDPTDDAVVQQITNLNRGNIGIGLPDGSTPDEKLHIEGDVKTIEVRALNFCGESGDDCMPPTVIGGNDPNMRCPIGQVVTAIENNTVTCAPPFTTAVVDVCDPGEFVTGISNMGRVICTTP